MMWHLLIMRVNNWKSPHMHFSNILCKKKTVQGTRNSKMLNKRMFFLLRKSWESSKSKQAIGTIYPCFVKRNSGKQLPPVVPGLFSVAQLAHTAYCSHSIFIPFCKAQTTQHPTKKYAPSQHWSIFPNTLTCRLTQPSVCKFCHNTANLMHTVEMGTNRQRKQPLKARHQAKAELIS